MYLANGSLSIYSRGIFKTDFYGASTARRLFLTANGYLGTAPAKVVVGDKMCLLFGGNVPFVVREEDNW